MNYPGVLFAGVELGDATGKHIKLPAGALRQEHGGPLREHRESLMLLLLPHLSLSEPCDGDLTACLPR